MRKLVIGAVALLTGLFALAPRAVEAQAVCSAPHSSPTLAQSGSIGTLPAGAGWIQLSAVGTRSTERFSPTGDGRLGFAGDAQFDTRSAYITGSFGVKEGFEIWGQVPLHRLSVDGPAGTSDSNGVGDVRVAARLSPELFDYGWPVAVRFGVKVPGSDFPVDATELPLSEGQIDFDLSIESGWKSEEYPIYVVGWVGHRWRTENTQVEYEPGDELFAHAAIGGYAGAFHLELGIDALWGDDLKEQGLVLPSERRRLVQLLPTVGTEVGGGTLELTTPISIAGRNLPASNGVSLGYRLAWGM